MQTSAILPLTNGKVAIVDSDYLHILRLFHWRAVQARRNWYAKTSFDKNGKPITISMHRFIARTKFGQVCHHKNRNSLDNRRDNLVNMDKKKHSLEHQMNNIQVKFTATPTETKSRTPQEQV